jgi:hypothetical protein
MYSGGDNEVHLRLDVNDLTMLEHFMNYFVLPKIVKNIPKKSFNDVEDTGELYSASRILHRIAKAHHHWMKEIESESYLVEEANKQSKGEVKQ